MLARPLRAPQVRSVLSGSKSKFANMIRITHRDEVEAPITDWLREAYDYSEAAGAKGNGETKAKVGKKARPKKPRPKKEASAKKRPRAAAVSVRTRRR